jgi:protein-tyrosine-phosphatase
MKLLFVCSGNICRSPAAEAMARRWLDERKLEAVQTASCGTLRLSGEPAAQGTLKGMRDRGVNLSAFRSRAMSYFLLREADWIFCLEQHHCDAVENELGGDVDLVKGGIHVLTEFHPDEDLRNNAGIYDFLRAIPSEYEEGLAELEICVHHMLGELEASGDLGKRTL